MEDRKYKISEAGASKLAGPLTDNLKSYMGDFVDETLVKYVIVLLGNGRSKDEVKGDLDVFLGDNSQSFVTWLWDHLAANINEYAPSSEPADSAVSNPKSKQDAAELPNSDTDNPKPRTRHNRDWKPLTQPHYPPLRSSITTVSKSRRSVSPQHSPVRKRPRPHDAPRNREQREPSRPTLAAPRRLLQFAVREAVGTARSYGGDDSMPSRKRLRSVVAAPIGVSADEVQPKRVQSVLRMSGGVSADEVQPQRVQSVTRGINPMATAIRAVAEAAEDVRRVKSVPEAAEDVRRVKTGNVFDRLSRADETIELVSTFREPAVRHTEYEDVRRHAEYVDYDRMHDNIRETYVQTKEYTRPYEVNASVMDSNTGMASDSNSDNEGYGNVNVVGSRAKAISERRTSRGNEDDDSLMVQYSVAQHRDEMAPQSRKKVQEQSASGPSTKHKIVNISVNVNTWKPPHYQPARDLVEVDTQKPTQKNDTGPSDMNVRAMKDNNNSVTVSGNGKAEDFQKEIQKSASTTTGRPLEDADSRTIFVNNVHFAATKDTLSRHFNKFGDVLKVIILTDAATGHPKGSAYVEFLRKEAAENALTLDGTSFMSRIIKVVKKTSGQLEASPVTTWPRITRGSSFSVPRFTQSPFPRVFPGAFRGRGAMKPGVRSMQWKRDSPQTSVDSAAAVSGNTTSATSAGRGLTYVRAEAKTDGNATGA